MTRRPVWLRREGDYVVVLIEENGEFREVIRAYDPEGKTPFSHIWEDQREMAGVDVTHTAGYWTGTGRAGNGGDM
jgi:hypothetical protein